METIDLGSRFLDATVRDGVIRVVINRAERRNALTMEMYRGIKRAAVIADGDPKIDAVVLIGRMMLLPHDLGNHPEHGAAIKFELSVVECSELPITDFHVNLWSLDPMPQIFDRLQAKNNPGLELGQ